MEGSRPPETAQTQLSRITTELATAQTLLVERVDENLKSCDHHAAGVVDLTAYDVLLCQACHDETLSCRMSVNWHVRECAYCYRIRALLPLPKQVIHPEKQEIAKIRDMAELVR